MNIIFYIKIIIKNILRGIIKLLFCFVRSKANSIFVIPDTTALYEPYTLTNYTGDNILFLLYYIIKNQDKKETPIKYIYVVAMNSFIENECITLQKKLKYLRLIPVVYPKLTHHFFDYMKYCFIFFKCRIIITPDVMAPLMLKRRKQTDICLVYYPAPFKSDIIKHSRAVKHQTEKYVISASDFAARMDLCASRVPYFDYKVLGFIRHDNIVNPRFDKPTIKKMIGVDEKIKNIVLYTPTHRDEKIDRTHAAILGCSDYMKLEKILYETNSVLIIKLHVGLFGNTLLGVENSKYIMIYEPSSEYTFYDILPYADLLITDYTSTYFDFLLTNKSVIFNFIDKIDYEKNRGLSYNPIDLFCVGKMAYTEDELYTAIQDVLSGKISKNDKHYNDVKNLFIKYTDGKTCERVYDFICSQIK